MPDRMVRAGSSIRLRAQFKDDYEDVVQATNVVVHIFEPDTDYTDLTEAYTVSGVPTYLGQGIFEYEFTSPAVGPDGTWYDVWYGDLVSQTISGVMEFDVTTEGLVSSMENQLYTNDLVQVTIGTGLEATDGTSLEEAYELEFLVTTSPSYSSARKVRLEVGSFISSVEDLVIELAILEASIEADALTFITGRYNDPLYQHARYEYVSCLAAATLLSNPGPLLLRSKTLADLSVTYDTDSIRDTMDKIKSCIDLWRPQLLAGGGAKAITQPIYVVKGELDPDRPVVSRSWHATDDGDLSRRVPAANDRLQPRRSRRYRRVWSNPSKKLW